MLAVARANLDYICCICFVDVRQFTSSLKVYDVKNDNISKILKLTAHITVLKNPINQKYINDYCRKVCETCFVKIQYSYSFREKIMASTATLKELLERNELSELEIERLSYFCRICFNRLENTKHTKCLTMLHINWLKDCSGIRFTSLVDREAFRIKEGTNINEIAVINDTNFPQRLCSNCFKKLENVEEFRRTTTQSFDYMISVIDGEIVPEEIPVAQREPILVKCEVVRMHSRDDHEHDNSNDEMPMTYDKMEQIINTTEYSNNPKIEEETVEDVMGFMDDISQYSNESEDEFTLNNNGDNYLKETRLKKSNQCNVNELNLRKKKKNIETEKAITPKIKIKEKRKRKQCKVSSDISHSENTKNCDDKKANEECSNIYSSICDYNSGHQRAEKNTDTTKPLYNCQICSKEFKRQSHLTDHINSVHEKLKPFKCSHCPKVFGAKNSRRVHELQHTGDYPFVCNWCGKMFRRPYQLKTHLEIHTTSPELLCPICKRSQKSQNDLENHLKSHDDKRLQCPLCGKLFTRSSHLKDHHNAVHLKLRPFKCEFCELAFGDRRTRGSHEKSHLEDRPIKCSDCGSGFKKHFTLTKHMRQYCQKITE